MRQTTVDCRAADGGLMTQPIPYEIPSLSLSQQPPVSGSGSAGDAFHFCFRVGRLGLGS